MNLNTSVRHAFLRSEGLQGTHIKPIWFKINDIDPKWRFVNLFSEFSPLWDAVSAANAARLCPCPLARSPRRGSSGAAVSFFWVSS